MCYNLSHQAESLRKLFQSVCQVNSKAFFGFIFWRFILLLWMGHMSVENQALDNQEPLPAFAAWLCRSQSPNQCSVRARVFLGLLGAALYLSLCVCFPLPSIPLHIQLLFKYLMSLRVSAFFLGPWMFSCTSLTTGARRSEMPLQHSTMPWHHTAVMSLQSRTQVNPLFLSALWVSTLTQKPVPPTTPRQAEAL